jgi:hypothetical protein
MIKVFQKFPPLHFSLDELAGGLAPPAYVSECFFLKLL